MCDYLGLSMFRCNCAIIVCRFRYIINKAIVDHTSRTRDLYQCFVDVKTYQSHMYNHVRCYSHISETAQNRDSAISSDLDLTLSLLKCSFLYIYAARKQCR